MARRRYSFAEAVAEQVVALLEARGMVLAAGGSPLTKEEERCHSGEKGPESSGPITTGGDGTSSTSMIKARELLSRAAAKKKQKR